jgi:hypothetical protein
MGLLKKASQAAKKVTKKVQKATVKSITKPLSKVPGAKNVAQKLEAESMRGIDKYSDMGQDLAANIGTGGAYGAAMAADQALDNPQAFAKGLTSREGLTNLGSQYAASQTGVDPSLMRAGAGMIQGQSLDPKAMALQAASSYAGQQYGLDPMLTEQGLNVAQGKGINAKNLATSFGAQQAGFDPNIARGIANQDMQGLVASQVPGADRMEILKNLTSQNQLQKQLGNFSQAGAEQAKNLLVKNAVGMGVPAEIANKIPVDQLQSMIQRGPSALKDLISNVAPQGAEQAVSEMPQLSSKDSGTFFDPLAEAFSKGKKTVKDWFSSEPEFGRGEVPAQEEQGLSLGDTFSKIGGKIKKSIGGAVGAIQDNPNLVNTVLGAAGSAAQYKALSDAIKSQQDIIESGKARVSGMKTFEQEHPELFKELAQGGPTSKYAQEMLGTAREAGQVAQAGRAAALERMSRMGRGGGELEAMLSGAQEGANRYAQAGQQAMMRDQDLRLLAQSNMSSIDRFNALQRQQAQSERENRMANLLTQEGNTQLLSGETKANMYGQLANAAVGGLTSASDARQKAALQQPQQQLQQAQQTGQNQLANLRNAQGEYEAKQAAERQQQQANLRNAQGEYEAKQAAERQQQQASLRNAQGEYEAKQAAQLKTAGTSLPQANQPVSTSPMNRQMNKPIAVPGTVPARKKLLNKPTSNIV